MMSVMASTCLLAQTLPVAADSNPKGESYLIWGSLLLFSGMFLAYSWWRSYKRLRSHAQQKDEAVSLGIDQPPAQHPQVNLSLCIGCGSCVKACPEGDVLGLIHGKATIINGLRCVGHGRCAEACPVEAIQVGLGDTKNRDDIPQTDLTGETNVPGLYIVGELGGLALIKNAILQGQKAVQAIAKTLSPQETHGSHDILIVGAGPAGLSAALAAKALGFYPVVIDQEKPGGSILHYPRKKLVLTQPVEIPSYGWLDKEEYTKEALLEIFSKALAEHHIEIQLNQRLVGIEKEPQGFLVKTETQQFLARKVILALGRRGTPRKLGVPGEAHSKVMYKLLDAAHYRHEHVLVVGGGDSAVEAAVALAQQPGNTVTISYRKPKFFRIKRKNQERIQACIEAGTVTALFDSHVEEITETSVVVRTEEGTMALENHYVFVFAGGIPPFALLKQMNIAFGDTREANALEDIETSVCV